MDLAARVLIALEFELQALVSKIVNTDSRVVGGDQELDLTIHISRGIGYRLYSGNLATSCIFSMRRFDMHLGLIFETLRGVELTHSMQTASDCSLPIRRKCYCSDEIGKLTPKCHGFVRNTPQSEL